MFNESLIRRDIRSRIYRLHPDPAPKVGHKFRPGPRRLQQKNRIHNRRMGIKAETKAEGPRKPLRQEVEHTPIRSKINQQHPNCKLRSKQKRN
uniref:Uncharacterized protein n=1 Tax=Bursaphelenchus xylophilus TaxID=6326 RepID=A0A1I7S2T3_BURXY